MVLGIAMHHEQFNETSVIYLLTVKCKNYSVYPKYPF